MGLICERLLELQQTVIPWRRHRPCKNPPLACVMRPCGALGSCCPLKNADSGQAKPPALCAGFQVRHGPGYHPGCWKDERKRTTSSVPAWAAERDAVSESTGPRIRHLVSQKAELGSLGCSVHSSQCPEVAERLKGIHPQTT